jgi:hypothetical protein
MADGFDNIVGGLFGASPEGLKIAREQQNLNFAKEVANAEAQRAGAGSVLGANVMGARGVQQLGNLFGVEDPLMQRVSQQQQLLGGVDFTNLKSLQTASQEAAKAGRPDIAQELAKRALDIQTKVEERQLTRDTQLQIARERIQGQLDAAIQRGADQKEIARIVTEGRQQIALLAASLKGPKALSSGLQKAEDENLSALDNYKAQQEALMPSIQALTKNSKGVRLLELGPVKNAEYLAQNAAGNSTPQSRAYETLKASVDTAVNLLVSAEKGVQTDADVKRFAQALIAAYGRNDTETTLQALKRYNEAIGKSASRTQERIESRRRSQNVDPYGFEQRPTTPATGQTNEVDFNSLPKRKQ